MPARKYTFFTRADEAALSDVLKKKFPSLIFVDNYHPWHPIESIVDSQDWKITMIIPPPGWTPIYDYIHPWTGAKYYTVVNHPDEVMMFQRSWIVTERLENERLTFGEGTFQVGVTATMNKAQRSLAQKVWRLFEQIGTYRLQAELKTGWKPVEGKMECAGNDAIRWVRQDRRRRFHYGSFDLLPMEDYVANQD
jgi:hypothetical protein